MPRKRVRSPSPYGEPAKKTKRATGKASAKATKAGNATAAESTAQAGPPAASKSEDGLNAGAKASARKPAGRPPGRPSARGRKKATGKVHADMGDQGNFQPVTPAHENQRKKANTSGAEADPDNDVAEAKDSGPAAATKTGDNIEVTLGPSNSKEDPTYAPSPAEWPPAAAASHAQAAGPSTPTDDRDPASAGLRVGGDSGSSSGDSEDIDAEDPVTAGVPFKSIQWQRPVPSGLSATGWPPRIAVTAEPLVTKPTDALPTIEKCSSSPYPEGGDALGLRVNEPHSEADDTHEHPWPSLQLETAASASVATEKPFFQQGSHSMNVDTAVKTGENLEPFAHDTALAQPTTDNPRPIPKKHSRPMDLVRSQVPRSVFSSMERYLNDGIPATSNQGLWLRGVQYGIGHGLNTMKQVILGEIEHNGFMFGRPYPLDAGLTRAEQRKVIESNTGFDLLVAQNAGDTFMAAHSRAMGNSRRHGSNNHSAVGPFPQAPPTYGAPAGHMNPGSTPTSPFLPRFATSLVNTRVLAAQGPRYPQTGPSFPRPSGGPWINPSANVAATPNYNPGDKMQPDEAALAGFGAIPDGLPRQPTDWRDGEFPCATPQLAATQDGRAVISMSRIAEDDDEA